jgi:monovalent cation:H+ antiporter-2, CPA2 family
VAIEAIQVIQDLAIVLLVALAMALLFYAIRQPALIGYLLAGIIVGPYTPPGGLLQQPEILNLFAEIGIVFLLFAIGLEYPLARLRAIGRLAAVIAVAESLATFLAGYLVGTVLGFSTFDSLFLGLAVSVTSTVILNKVLEELGVLGDGVAGLILGITIIEDVLIVSALGVLQSLAITGRISLLEVGLGVAAVVVFIGVALVVGTRVVPRFIDGVAKTGRADLLLVAVLGVAFGLSILSSLLGISVATGAFLGGLMVAESKNQAIARALLAPLKDLFGAIFFVSMGALMDVRLLPSVVLAIVLLLTTSVFAKVGVTYLAARGQRIPSAAARRTAIGLAGPGGELSLAIAKGGADVQAINPFVLPIVGIITLVTAFLSAFRVRFAWGAREPLPLAEPS